MQAGRTADYGEREQTATGGRSLGPTQCSIKTYMSYGCMPTHVGGIVEK